MTALVLVEVRAVAAEPRRGRRCPRAVKRKMSDFPSRSRAAPTANAKTRSDDAIRIVAPPPPVSKEPVAAEAGPTPTTTAASPPPSSPRRGRNRQSDAADHVRAWRRSGLTRTEYCQRHDLNPTAFHQWVARLGHIFRKREKTAKVTALTTRH